jgi:hypothetical protein
MKVIDMLDRIANGEEVKFKIIETDEVLKLTKDMHLFSNTWNEPVEWMIDEEWLNYEVEIIEDKINKDIKWYFIEDQEAEKTKIAQINMNFKILREKLTEIIDKLNEMEKE